LDASIFDQANDSQDFVGGFDDVKDKSLYEDEN